MWLPRGEDKEWAGFKGKRYHQDRTGVGEHEIKADGLPEEVGR